MLSGEIFLPLYWNSYPPIVKIPADPQSWTCGNPENLAPLVDFTPLALGGGIE